MKFSIYLVGKIPKGEEIPKFDNWRDKFTEIVESKLNDYSKISKIVFLDPYTLEMNRLDNTLDFFGRDIHMISICNAVVVDASIKVGPGSAQEILIAKYYNKPVVSVIPKNSHYWKDTIVHGGKVDYKHPFLFSTSDVVVESLEQAAEWILRYFSGMIKQNIKGIDILENSRNHYLRNHLQNDEFVTKWQEEMKND
jgi:hypothetical protein